MTVAIPAVPSYQEDKACRGGAEINRSADRGADYKSECETGRGARCGLGVGTGAALMNSAGGVLGKSGIWVERNRKPFLLQRHIAIAVYSRSMDASRYAGCQQDSGRCIVTLY